MSKSTRTETIQGTLLHRCILNCRQDMVDSGFILLQAVCTSCEPNIDFIPFNWTVLIDGREEKYYSQIISVNTDGIQTMNVSVRGLWKLSTSRLSF